MKSRLCQRARVRVLETLLGRTPYKLEGASVILSTYQFSLCFKLDFDSWVRSLGIEAADQEIYVHRSRIFAP